MDAQQVMFGMVLNLLKPMGYYPTTVEGQNRRWRGASIRVGILKI
jgi:hypothetical protein